MGPRTPPRILETACIALEPCDNLLRIRDLPERNRERRTPRSPDGPATAHGAEAGTPPDAGGAAPTRDSTRPFAPAGPTPPDDRQPPRIAADTQIGKYRIVEPIGGGGMGYVYLALNPDLGCPVA